MTALTPDDLARIEELAEKATPGPWELSGEDVILGPQPDASGWLPGHGPRRYWIIEENTGEGGGYTIEPEDAAFIVSARTAVPALVAGVRSLQARITELEAAIAQAPHAPECLNLTPAHYFAKPACTCWKSRYRAGAPE